MRNGAELTPRRAAEANRSMSQEIALLVAQAYGTTELLRRGAA